MNRRIMLVALMAMLFSAAVSARQPIIGISSYNEGRTCVANLPYIESVRLAGGVPLIIPVTDDDSQIEAILEAVDGLIMTGGADFDPLKWYGEEPLRQLGGIEPERDLFDVKLIRAAVAKGIPVLGTCRGEQLMAVAFGGSLWQDIPSQVEGNFVKHSQSSTESGYPTHSITIIEGTILRSLLDTGKTAVNSFHHQAVKDVPSGFKVSAVAADGVIEAVERCGRIEGFDDAGGWILGVQFHPECLLANGGYEEFLPLFKALVEESLK